FTANMRSCAYLSKFSSGSETKLRKCVTLGSLTKGLTGRGVVHMRRVFLSIVSLVIVTSCAAAAVESSAAADAKQSYIVVYRPSTDVDAKTGQLERSQGFAAAFRYHTALKGFAARLNDQQLARVQADPSVAYVSADATVETTDTLQTGETVPTGIRRIG